MSNFAANTDTRTARTRADERGFITFFRLIVMDNNPHILGTERIGKLLLQYSIPAIIGMTITSLYNIIDSISSVTVWVQWVLPDWPLLFR